jgi:hypothetical protein
MADLPIVHIGENSPEQVAYKLLIHVAAAEGHTLLDGPSAKGASTPGRGWILDAYAECLKAVRGNRSFGSTKAAFDR